MPNCFSLTRKGATEPESLNQVDEAICAHLSIPVHPTAWALNWYNVIGFSLACGKPMEAILSTLRQYAAVGDQDERDLLRVGEFIAETYQARSWCER